MSISFALSDVYLLNCVNFLQSGQYHSLDLGLKDKFRQPSDAIHCYIEDYHILSFHFLCLLDSSNLFCMLSILHGGAEVGLWL